MINTSMASYQCTPTEDSVGGMTRDFLIPLFVRVASSVINDYHDNQAAIIYLEILIEPLHE